MTTYHDLDYNLAAGALPEDMMRAGEHYTVVWAGVLAPALEAKFIEATKEGWWAMKTTQEVMYVNPAHVANVRPETLG